MKKEMSKSKVRSIVRWIFWVIVVQFLLLNISAAFYAHKFTRLYTPEERVEDFKRPVSQNIFAKTWRLFSGYRFYKYAESETPFFEYTAVQLFTKDKIPVEAWYSRTDSLSKGAVILFHGLMGNKSFVIKEAMEFLTRGYNVMLMDVRAHGKSGGNTTTIGFNESEEVKLAFDYVRQQGEKTIFLWGISMGAVEIIKAVADYKLGAAGIILEMPFGSLQSHIRGRIRRSGFPQQPFSLLITFWIGIERGFNGFGFRPDQYAKKIDCPVLMQYGIYDQLVTRKEIDAIYKALVSPRKKLVIYENASHESLLRNDPRCWEKEVDEFLAVNE